MNVQKDPDESAGYSQGADVGRGHRVGAKEEPAKTGGTAQANLA